MHLPNHRSKEFDSSLIERHFRANIATSGAANRVSILKGYSIDILPVLPANSYDFIYIDASHKAKDVLDDAVFSWRLLKNNGLLFFDDYRYTEGETDSDRPKMAIDAFLSVRPGDVDILDHYYQFYIRKLT